MNLELLLENILCREVVIVIAEWSYYRSGCEMGFYSTWMWSLVIINEIVQNVHNIVRYCCKKVAEWSAIYCCCLQSLENVFLKLCEEDTDGTPPDLAPPSVQVSIYLCSTMYCVSVSSQARHFVYLTHHFSILLFLWCSCIHFLDVVKKNEKYYEEKRKVCPDFLLIKLELWKLTPDPQMNMHQKLFISFFAGLNPFHYYIPIR